jgi:hypothetical protein
VTRHCGPVLTHASLDALDAAVVAGRYDTVKVVSAWGVPGGWTRDARAFVCAATPITIVRTATGDGCRGLAFVDADAVEAEIAPWYAIKRRIWIELGNEPNAMLLSEEQAWVFRWHLRRAIARCRRQFPQARLIAPAIAIPGAPYDRLLAICRDAYDACDAIGIHAYAHRQFDDDGQLARALETARGRPAWLSEYGINAADLSDVDKAQRYVAMLRSLPGHVLGATHYHLNTLGDVHPQYALRGAGDAVMGRRW